MKRIIIPLLIAVLLLALAGTIQQCTKGEREASGDEISRSVPAPDRSVLAPGR
ncbi:hypothetical protein [Microbulbifer guangxiensis]|uniref:hypothetical protein n=1 Tax=Microbulbifer guangxiensis TaxID=2904249 RepID=UPI001F45228B|nr:hypothetical protein [Microbulbifer guangxiensis]